MSFFPQRLQKKKKTKKGKAKKEKKTMNFHSQNIEFEQRVFDFLMLSNSEQIRQAERFIQYIKSFQEPLKQNKKQATLEIRRPGISFSEVMEKFQIISQTDELLDKSLISLHLVYKILGYPDSFRQLPPREKVPDYKSGLSAEELIDRLWLPFLHEALDTTNLEQIVLKYIGDIKLLFDQLEGRYLSEYVPHLKKLATLEHMDQGDYTYIIYAFNLFRCLGNFEINEDNDIIGFLPSGYVNQEELRYSAFLMADLHGGVDYPTVFEHESHPGEIFNERRHLYKKQSNVFLAPSSSTSSSAEGEGEKEDEYFNSDEEFENQDEEEVNERTKKREKLEKTFDESYSKKKIEEEKMSPEEIEKIKESRKWEGNPTGILTKYGKSRMKFRMPGMTETSLNLFKMTLAPFFCPSLTPLTKNKKRKDTFENKYNICESGCSCYIHYINLEQVVIEHISPMLRSTLSSFKIPTLTNILDIQNLHSEETKYGPNESQLKAKDLVSEKIHNEKMSGRISTDTHLYLNKEFEVGLFDETSKDKQLLNFAGITNMQTGENILNNQSFIRFFKKKRKGEIVELKLSLHAKTLTRPILNKNDIYVIEPHNKFQSSTRTVRSKSVEDKTMTLYKLKFNQIKDLKLQDIVSYFEMLNYHNVFFIDESCESSNARIGKSCGKQVEVSIKDLEDTQKAMHRYLGGLAGKRVTQRKRK